MRKSQVIKHLDHLDEDELRSEILVLYEQVEGVKQYYTMELGSQADRQQIYDKAKKQIIAKYATKSYRKPRRPRIQKINLILASMAKKSVFTHELIDLYCYDAEAAIQFMRHYNYFSEILANHIIQIFEKAVKLIAGLKLWDEWRVRIEQIMASVRFSTGIHIELEDIYDKYL